MLFIYALMKAVLINVTCLLEENPIYLILCHAQNSYQMSTIRHRFKPNCNHDLFFLNRNYKYTKSQFPSHHHLHIYFTISTFTSPDKPNTIHAAQLKIPAFTTTCNRFQDNNLSIYLLFTRTHSRTLHSAQISASIDRFV